MAAGGANPPPTGPYAQVIAQQRQSRWLSSEYGDETKLRELSAKHARIAAKSAQRVAHLNTRIDRLRHSAAVLREKAARVREPISLLTSEIATLKTGVQQAMGGNPKASGSDITKMQLKARKLEQKIADRQSKATRLEAAAAHRTQKATELKIRADTISETQRAAEAESIAYRQRADNLQAARQSAGGPGTAGSPPAPP